jgi:hypothetical protein
MKDIDDLIEEFNDGDTEKILTYFGDFETFFRAVDRRGKVSEISLNTGYSDEYENELLLYFYENDIDKFYHWCKIYLDDIEYENGKVYCIRPNASDFAVLYCDNRDVSRSTIESLLDGEADFDWYDDGDVDVFNYVIEELNEKNLKELKHRFVVELTGIQVSPETQLLEEIAEEQGHSDSVTVDSSNIDRIFRDKITIEYLLEDELDSEIENELARIYNMSNNTAIESEYYKEVWGELTDDYFNGEPDWVTRNHTYKKDTRVPMVKLEIRNFDGIITDYLRANKKYGASGTLSYPGSYLELLRNEIDCLSVRFPDYPSHPEKYINEYFSDYF